MGLVADEFVQLFEGTFIEQQVHAFAGTELALLVLAFATFSAAARFGLGIELAKLFEAVVVFTMSGHGQGAR